MKKVLLVFALFLIIVGAMFFTQSYLQKGGQLAFFKKGPTITIDNRSFELKVASSQKEKEIGLSETKSLPENQGMIFLFEKSGYYSFWMKDMKFSIDIIYINNDKIVTIFNNVAPPKGQNESLTVYALAEPSDRVLEIKAGLSKMYNFKKGDSVKYENLGN